MEELLIVSTSEGAYQALAKFLVSCNVSAQTFAAYSGVEARRMISRKDYETIIINTPLSDEFGVDLALHIAQNSISGIILFTKSEITDTVSEKVEDEGVVVLSKPLNRAFFLQALRMLRTTRNRLSGLQKENLSLQKKLENIRLFNRAKGILMETQALSESEAHLFLEQQAMQRRLTKRDIALEIIQQRL